MSKYFQLILDGRLTLKYACDIIQICGKDIVVDDRYRHFIIYATDNELAKIKESCLWIKDVQPYYPLMLNVVLENHE